MVAVGGYHRRLREAADPRDIAMNGSPVQPRYLTLTEMVFGYGLYGGIGYLAAGVAGLCCGAALLTLLIARQIWLASRL